MIPRQPQTEKMEPLRLEKRFPPVLCQKTGSQDKASLRAGGDERLQALSRRERRRNLPGQRREPGPFSRSRNPSVNMAAGIWHKGLGNEQRSSRAGMAPNSSPILKAEKGKSQPQALRWGGTGSGGKVPRPQLTCMAGRAEGRGKLRNGQFLPSSPKPPPLSKPALCQVKCLPHLTKTGKGRAEFFG